MFLVGLAMVGLGLVLPLATTFYFVIQSRLSSHRLRAGTNLLLYGLSLVTACSAYALTSRFAPPGLMSLFLLPFLLSMVFIGVLNFRKAYIKKKNIFAGRVVWPLVWPAIAGPLGFVLALWGIARFGSPTFSADLESMLSASCNPGTAFHDGACTNKREIKRIARINTEALYLFISDQAFPSDGGKKLRVGEHIYSDDGSSTPLPVDAKRLNDRRQADNPTRILIPGTSEVAYLAPEGKKTRVVWGKTTSTAFDSARLVSSPDGKHLASIGVFFNSDADGLNIIIKTYLDLDGTDLGPFDGSLYGPAFSNDGNTAAWILDSHDETLVIRNLLNGTEKRVELGWDFPADLPIFSPDDKRIAFRHFYSDRTNWGTISFFSGGKLFGGYVHGWVSEPFFSEDGNSVTYWALDGTKLSYIREQLQ